MVTALVERSQLRGHRQQIGKNCSTYGGQPSVLIGLIQATLILLVAQLWVRIPFAGSYVTLHAGLALFLTAAVGMGLMLSAVVATMQQAVLYAFVIMMPCARLSGLATPPSNMPQVLQYATLANPLRYAIDMARRAPASRTSTTPMISDKRSSTYDIDHPYQRRRPVENTNGQHQ